MKDVNYLEIIITLVWLQTWMISQFKKTVYVLFELALLYLPDYFFLPLKKESPYCINYAIDEKKQIITNKLSLYINWFWDAEDGSVEIYSFMRAIDSTTIVFIYKTNKDLRYLAQSSFERNEVIVVKQRIQLNTVMVNSHYSIMEYLNGGCETLLFGELKLE